MPTVNKRAAVPATVTMRLTWEGESEPLLEFRVSTARLRALLTLLGPGALSAGAESSPSCSVEGPDQRSAMGAVRIKDAVQFCGIGKSELYNMMSRGELPYFKHGSRRLIPRQALREWVAKKLATPGGD